MALGTRVAKQSILGVSWKTEGSLAKPTKTLQEVPYCSMWVEKASFLAQYVFENIFSYGKSIPTHKLSLNIPSDATLST